MICYILNLADVSFTLYAVGNGVRELNPFMRGIPFMVFYKVVVVGLLCWWLSKRGEPIARYGLHLCSIYYAITDLYHIINLLQ